MVKDLFIVYRLLSFSLIVFGIILFQIMTLWKLNDCLKVVVLNVGRVSLYWFWVESIQVCCWCSFPKWGKRVIEYFVRFARNFSKARDLWISF